MGWPTSRPRPEPFAAKSVPANTFDVEFPALKQLERIGVGDVNGCETAEAWGIGGGHVGDAVADEESSSPVGQAQRAADTIWSPEMSTARNVKLLSIV